MPLPFRGGVGGGGCQRSATLTVPTPTPPLKGRGFSEAALQLAGQTSVLLGWRPDDFWSATPAELATILSAMSPTADAADGSILQHLMKEFPDAHTAVTRFGDD